MSEELVQAKNELIILEKKNNLGKDLLAKVNDSDLISKLKKQNEECDCQKNKLINKLQKMEYIADSIDKFLRFSIFIKKFYTLAIEKKNFEDGHAKISLRLLANLQVEEENLYNQYITQDYFSKVLHALNFKKYQSLLEKYAKNFFKNTQYTDDPYINSLLKLKILFFECKHFLTDSFDLSDLSLFLSKKIPANFPVPKFNYERIGLRCFFFHSLLVSFFKKKLLTTYFEQLKEAINLDCIIVEYKADTKHTLIFYLNNLKEEFVKLDKRRIDFLLKRSENNPSTTNQELVFYKKITNEIQIISKKTKDLINNKYLKLEKMRRLLALIVNEANLRNFLNVFNEKIGSDFLLSALDNPNNLETNKEALSYLFHALRRDKFYTPLNEKISECIDKFTQIYPKDDLSILDDITQNDLIEFSFYYIFIFLYFNFNTRLSALNTRLLYAKMVTLSAFFNEKFQRLDLFEKKINTETKKFFEKNFKDIVSYNAYKRNVLAEIKLHLQMLQDLNSSAGEMKSLETKLATLDASLVGMQEKKMMLEVLNFLEKKQQLCGVAYQTVQTHQFINKISYKSKTDEKIIKLNNVVQFKDKLEDSIIAIKTLTEIVGCLSENLSDCLKYIQEITSDVKRSHQKISSALGKFSASLQRFLVNLSHCQGTKIDELVKFSLLQLLEITEEWANKNNLLESEDLKNKITTLHERFNSPSLSIDSLIKLIINEYYQCNKKLKNCLNKLSSFFIDSPQQPHFFSRKLPEKKEKSQLYEKLIKKYFLLDKQSIWIKKLARLLKCDTDEQLFTLYTLHVEAEDYQKSYIFLNKKINEKNTSSKKFANKKLNVAKQIFPDLKETLSDEAEKPESSYLLPLTSQVRDRTSKNFLSQKTKVSLSFTSTRQKQHVNEISINNQDFLNTENNLEEDTLSFELSQGEGINNSELSNVAFLKAYETWNLEFEQWKNEKNVRLYELFHMIENCSKVILNSTDQAFLKCLFLYEKELTDKNDSLKEKENEISLYLKNSSQVGMVVNYFAQRQKWFDEIFQRIIFCRALLLQNKDLVIQECPRFPSALADNRAEFNRLLTFYLSATHKYNKFRDNLFNEENKLNHLNQSFIKLMLGSLDKIDNEAQVLSDFSKQLDRVNQLKLAIEQEFETKQKIKEKLTWFASPDVVKFYLSRIDPYDADTLKNSANDLFPNEAKAAPNYYNATMLPHYTINSAPVAFYLPVTYPVEVVAPMTNQLFYSM